MFKVNHFLIYKYEQPEVIRMVETKITCNFMQYFYLYTFFTIYEMRV